MKKFIFILFVLFCFMAFAISYATAERRPVIDLELSEKEIITEAKLPGSVEIIEAEAFEGTALVKVELPETVETLGERAFANISTLREIRIPIATKHIAGSAFEGSNRTMITAPGDSYARTWAKNHGFPFSPVIMFCASAQGPSIQILTLNRATEVKDGQAVSELKPDTQWRRVTEINTTRTEELIANHVQGRSPPMA